MPGSSSSGPGQDGRYQAERRRVIRRDVARERQAANGCGGRASARPRTSGSTDGQALELPARDLPRVVGPPPGGLARRGRGEAVPPGGRLPDRGDVRASTGSSCTARSTSAIKRCRFPTLLAALRRGEDIVPLGDGTFGLLPEEWLKKYGRLAGLGTPEGDHLRFRRTQVGLLDALLAAQPEARFDERFERARERLRQFEGIAPADPPAGFQGQLRGYQRDGLGWLHFLRRVRLRRLPRRRHGPGQDRPGARPAGGAPRAAGRAPGNAADPGRRWSWCRGRSSSTGSRRPRASRPKLRVLDHTGIGRAKPGRALRRLRPHPDHLRHASARRRRPQGLRVRLRHPRRGPGDQERRAAESAKAARLLRGGAPPGPQRHAGREPPGRAVEPVRVPQPRHARHGRGASARPTARLRKPGEETTVAPGAGPPAVHPPAHQGAGRARTCPPKTEQTIYCDLEPAQRKLYDELREHYRAVAARARRARRDQEGRRSRSSRRCCGCARRPAIPA